MADQGERSLRVATYNVHGCVGIDGRRSEGRIAEVVAALEVDIIGLQELDLNRRRSAGMDQPGMIARQLGWTSQFHPAMSRAEEHYGDAILSRYPMRLRQAALLPEEGAPFYCRETRAALWVEVETPLGRVQVFNTHFGLGRRERERQAQALTGPEWLGRVREEERLIVLGDFNSQPGSRAYREIVSKLRDARSFVSPAPPLRTYPTPWPVAAVDHIFVGPGWTVETVGVARSAEARVASDHYPVVAALGAGR